MNEELDAALKSFGEPIDQLSKVVSGIEDGPKRQEMELKIQALMGLLVDIEFTYGSWKLE